MLKNLPAMPETWVQSLVWEDPLEKGMATHSIILAWRIPCTVHWFAKSQTRLRVSLSKYVGGGGKQGLKFREKSGFCNLFTRRVPFCSSHECDTMLAGTHGCSLGEN